MNEQQTTKISKFLSLVLRHRPQMIGIALDPAGWVDVSALLEGMRRHGRGISEAELREVVETDDKRRYSFSEDGLRIRASQGHSVEVELGYEPAEPPELLYHGTVERFVESIRREGLRKGNRHHVHLSPDRQTAGKVGERRGEPVILIICAGRMHRDGFAFFRSANGVWLTDPVPAEYIEVEKENI